MATRWTPHRPDHGKWPFFDEKKKKKKGHDAALGACTSGDGIRIVPGGSTIRRAPTWRAPSSVCADGINIGRM
ncbi:MAG: hypothetical protein IPL75_13870 [Acidobacteria bacterium]|nr:hypothetical protein [Acidobacteriota bacterium]